MSTPAAPTLADGSWCLYLIECRNGSWYAGITNHLDARYATHLAGRGARYTRANPPVQLLGFREYPDRAIGHRVAGGVGDQAVAAGAEARIFAGCVMG